MKDENTIDNLLQKANIHLSLFEKAELKEQLMDYINYLLLHDFNKLIVILYRVDVSEQKLKNLIQEHPQTDSAILIADLLLERQIEKIKTRQSFPSKDDIPDSEKW